MKDFGRHTQKSKYIVLTYDLILPLFVILTIVIGLVLAVKSNLFSLKVIRCQLDYQDCSVGPVMAELEKYLGQNLLKLKTDEIKARLTTGDFTIREATISKKLPDTLVVDLQSVYPVAALRVMGVENEWLVFDSKYRVIGLRKTDPNTPTVLVESAPSFHIGQQVIDPLLTKALDLSVVIGSEIPSVKTISLSADVVTLSLDGEKTALMSVSKDRMTQIRTLQAILAESTMRLGETRTIDVRFSKPVLR